MLDLEIQNALTKLNPAEDKDWTENGSPSLKRMRQLLKNDSLTQEQLDEFASGAKRPEMKKPAGLETHREPDKEAIEFAKKNHVIDESVVALERGYASGAVREPGDVFLFSCVMGSWRRKEEPDERKERLKAVRDR